MSPYYVVLTDFPAITLNARSVLQAQAKATLTAWGITEELDPQVIAGTGEPSAVLQLLAQHYRGTSSNAAISPEEHAEFAAAVAQKIRPDGRAQRHLQLLRKHPAVFDIGLILTQWQAEANRRILGGFSAKRFVVDPSVQGMRQAINEALIRLGAHPAVCVVVFGSTAGVEAAKAEGVHQILGHINGQGPLEEALLRTFGATATASNWDDVVLHLIKHGCILPQELLDRLPKQPPAKPSYLLRESGPSTSIFTPMQPWPGESTGYFGRQAPQPVAPQWWVQWVRSTVARTQELNRDRPAAWFDGADYDC